MQFHKKKIDFTRVFFAWTFFKFLARCGAGLLTLAIPEESAPPHRKTLSPIAATAGNCRSSGNASTTVGLGPPSKF